MIKRSFYLHGIAVSAMVLFYSAPSYAEILIPDELDPLFSDLVIPQDAARRGMWSPLARWPLVGLHSALTPSGTVLSYGTPIGQGYQDGRTFDVWDPAKGLGADSHVTLPNAQSVDSFCSAATNMVSGAMLISGGNTPESGYSSLASTSFDPSTQTANPVAAQLALPRWYGTMITLSDGRPLMVGGGKPYVVDAWTDVIGSLERRDVSMTPEVFEDATGWRKLNGATSRAAFGPDHNRWWYPRMWVAPNGKVFGVSSEKAWFLDPEGSGSLTSMNFKSGADYDARPNIGPTSTAVMYDVGKILQVGGNGYQNGHGTPSSAAATIFDVTSGYSAIATTPMNKPRQWANATVLPNGEVLVTGGTRFADNAGTDAVRASEIWSPSTQTWKLGASAARYRGYHSSAILLQNGTVLSTGGGAPGPVTNLNAEVYYPPYLFDRSGDASVLASRPKLAAISTNAFSPGETIGLRLASGSTVSSVALIGLSSTTHSFNSGQRYQKLPFTRSGLTITATLPANAHLTPPGYYQVVVVNRGGAPSRGAIVSIGASAPKAVEAQPVSSLLSVDLAGHRLRHRDFLGFVSAISQTSSARDKADSAYYIRPGLADENCYSFEARNVRGYYLRHSGYRLQLHRYEGNELYRNDATFCRRPGLAGQGFSFESKNFPDHFLRHIGTEMWIDQNNQTPGFAGTASYHIVSALE